MNIWNCFKEAFSVAVAKEDHRGFLIGALGIRSDGVKVMSANGPVLISDKCKHKNTYRRAHAEYRLCQKIDKGATIFVVRIGKSDGKYKLAKPCPACQIVLRSKQVAKVYYTISENEYGVMEFD